MHLKWGYYTEYPTDDPRQGTGEALIVYTETEGVITDIVRVHSPSFDWRLTMRGNNANIVHQFYTLLNTVYPNISSEETWSNLQKRYIMFPIYEPASIKHFYQTTGYILTIPQGEISRDDYFNKEHRIKLLWLNYVLSLPPWLQGRGIDLLEEFRKDRNDLAEWIQGLEKQHKQLSDLSIYHERIKSEKGIINQSRHFAKQSVASGNNFTRNGKIIPLPKLIGNNIRNFIYKENGTSLYALIKEMKRAKAGLLLKDDSPKVIEHQAI
jgi:hypothetical protein